MNRLHRAEILSNKDAGRGYWRMRLKAEGIGSTAVPGQFVMLRVSENLDPLLARPFGIFSVQSKNIIEIVYRIVGRGTMLLSNTQPGQELLMLGPLGNGFPAMRKGAVPVLVSGGSGFPPLYFLASKSRRQAIVLLGARSEDCLPPKDVVAGFRRLSSQVMIATEDGSAGKKGLITDLLEGLIKDRGTAHGTVIYTCGPNAMLCAVSMIAAGFGIECHVSMEERMACGLGACMGCSIPMKAGGYKRACKEGPVFNSGDVQWKHP